MSADAGGAPPPFDALLWDMDGTLADSEPIHARSFEIACAELGLVLPGDFHDQLLGQGDAETHAWLVRTCGLSVTLTDWLTRRFEIFQSGLAEITPQPAALAIWQEAAARGVPQAVVSNSDRILVSATLAQLGLARPGQITVTRNDVHRGKPAADPYLRAADLLGVAPGRAAVIEDSPTGARAGLAAGMSVFVMPHYHGPAELPVRPLEALAALLTTQG